MHRRRKGGTSVWTVVLVAAAACVCGGCDSDMAKDFREASGASLEQGVDYIVAGLVDGAFELWDPDTSSSSSDSSS